MSGGDSTARGERQDLDPDAAPAGRADAVLSRLEMWGQKLGLERIRAVLDRLEHPELRVPTVLIAGTNGKGSTAALLAAIGHAAGLRTGLYTSPHLEAVEERIRVDGRAIESARLGDRLEEVLAASSPALPTYFEALTAAAFLDFARCEVELAVVEVGLGGRLDATNAADPLLSVVTQLSFDHQEHLGDTLAAIAREKAGIFRSDRPALCWSAGDPEVSGALAAAAAERGARLEDCSATVTVEVAAAPEGGAFDVTTPCRRHRLSAALAGRHQGPNVALAVRAAERLRDDLGFGSVDDAAVRSGVARCRWPGRLERVELPDGRFVLLDAAHNPGGVDALVEHLAGLPTQRPATLLYGSLAGKGAERSLPLLAAGMRQVTLARPPSDRALDPERLLAEVGDALDPAAVRVEPDPEAALDRALSGLGGGEGLLVCGSLYLTGAVRDALHRRFGVPPRAVDVATS